VIRAETLIARSAWRLRNLIGHFGTLQLSINTGTQTEEIALSQLAQPAEIMSRADGEEFALPRGVIALCAAQRATAIVAAPAEITIKLSDRMMARELVHATVFVSVNDDRWKERPLVRYTVGPIGEVQHYI
jgi:hypothetical protein